MDLKAFLIEKKNQKIFILAIFSTFLFVIALFLLAFFIVRSQSNSKKKTENTIVLPSPTTKPEEKKEESIQSLGYTIDCQLVVTTSIKKIYVKKLDRCDDILDYKVAPSKKYAVYKLIDKNKTAQLFAYSLENNIEGIFQVVSQPIVLYQFDSRDNLSILFGRNTATNEQSFVYYFIPLLFSEYPENYYKELNTFTNIDKRKIEIPLPEMRNIYARVEEQPDGLILKNVTGVTLYTIGFKDLELQLSPTQVPIINRNLLAWNKRLFVYSKGVFKTMDLNGMNQLDHHFICEGIEVFPIDFRDNLFARSPDGRTLAFLVPKDEQMRDNPTWKIDILAGKKIFNQGEMVIYDFIKSDCQRTGVMQTIRFRESFAFSPNGLYIAFANQGVNLYNLQTHQDYQLVFHNATSESDMTMVTGPLVWDGESRFIYTMISKLENEKIASTKLVRLYFNDRYEGTEQNILSLSNDTLYAVSPDGSKILYTKNTQIYKYDVDRKLNSLFSSDSIEKINKLVWLRNGTIVSNIWYANENLYFTKLPEMKDFQIDFDQETIAYGNPISLYDLVLRKQRFFKDKQMIEGNPLLMFY